ncbi:hypothetical protein TNCV_3331521 [Trichonephila clavipes]|nr:hypothetical protein TNCV_3331521 [Trichonephila clavipes]
MQVSNLRCIKGRTLSKIPHVSKISPTVTAIPVRSIVKGHSVHQWLNVPQFEAIMVNEVRRSSRPMHCTTNALHNQCIGLRYPTTFGTVIS